MRRTARTVHLSPNVAMRINRLAAASRRSQSAVCADLIERALDVEDRRKYREWSLTAVFIIGLIAAFLAGTAI